MAGLSREDRRALRVLAGVILSALGAALIPLAICNILLLIPALYCLGIGLLALVSFSSG